MPTEAKKRFSMIREFHLADWITLANAACGTSSFFAMITFLQTNDTMHLYYAGALLMAALALDVMDGRVARWRRKSSPLGRDLDSLADIVSFGVAPAVLAYSCGMQGLYDRILLAIFVTCGVSRLARFNVTASELSFGGDKVKYFEGTPIPTSLGLVALLMVAVHQGAIGANLWLGTTLIAGHQLHPLVLLYAVSGAFMVSRIKIPKI